MTGLVNRSPAVLSVLVGLGSWSARANDAPALGEVTKSTRAQSKAEESAS